MTNYEKIKEKSVDEMALFLAKTNNSIAIKLENDYVGNDVCSIYDWLNNEVS